LLYLSSYKPGDKAPRNHGPISVSNPDFTTFTGKDGKLLPFHSGFVKLPGGTTTTRYVALGICEARDGNVYIEVLHPLSLLQVAPSQLK
jgi:hypothetical protein